LARRFVEPRLLIASTNAGKVGEIEALLSPFRIAVVGMDALNLGAAEETGATCRDNAILKARAAAKASALPALADDSGLEVEALGGWPGARTADEAGPDRDYPALVQRLVAMPGVSPERRARLLCVLALAWPDGGVEVVEGEARGRLVWPGRGAQGWGLDPHFAPDPGPRTWAEMTAREKEDSTHRGAAFRALVARCFAP
jgi:XTP/dITP diphosphohydrolase